MKWMRFFSFFWRWKKSRLHPFFFVEFNCSWKLISASGSVVSKEKSRFSAESDLCYLLNVINDNFLCHSQNTHVPPNKTLQSFPNFLCGWRYKASKLKCETKPWMKTTTIFQCNNIGYSWKLFRTLFMCLCIFIKRCIHRYADGENVFPDEFEV